MSRVLDRLAIRSAKALGIDPCVVVAWVGWALSWHPEVRAVRREILRRVVTTAFSVAATANPGTGQPFRPGDESASSRSRPRRPARQ